MAQDAFTKLDKKESQDVVASINPVLEGGAFDAETVTVLAQDLSFYPGCRFLDVADFSAVPALQRFAVYGPGRAVLLNGTNEPIYQLNKDVPLSLNDGNIFDYVRFFFGHVRGRHGRFIITESVEDIAWREEPPPAVRKAVGQLLEPLELASAADGTYKLAARILFRDSLFKATITVQPDGNVGISQEELLIEDIPVLDDTFGQ
jgi:hypothetical protein